MTDSHRHSLLHSAFMKNACVGVLVSACVMVSSLGLGGCSSHDDRYKQSFSRNRASALARAASLASETSAGATETINQAFKDMDAALAASEPAEVFEDARRIRSRYESNAKLASDRLKNVETAAQQLLTEWAAESRKLADPARKAAARADLASFKAVYEPVKKSSQRMQEALSKPAPILADDVLYIKYRRLSQSTQASTVSPDKEVSRELPPAIVNTAQREQIKIEVQEANSQLQKTLDALMKRLQPAESPQTQTVLNEPEQEPRSEASRLIP